MGKNNSLVKTVDPIATETPIYQVDTFKQTALYRAIKQGHTKWVKLLLAQGIHSVVDVNNKDGMTLLHVAAYKGHTEIVQSLLTCGFSVDSPTNICRTALHAAAYKGHVKVVSLLLAYRANANNVDKYGYTALHLAAHRGHVEILKLLLAHGADAKLQTVRKYTALDLAKKNRADIKILLQQVPITNDASKNIGMEPEEESTNQSARCTSSSNTNHCVFKKY